MSTPSPSPSHSPSPTRQLISLREPSVKKQRRTSKTGKLFRSVRSVFRTFPIITPACKMPAGVSRINVNHVHGGTRMTGTLFGCRKGRITLAIQENSRCLPMLLLELAIPTAKLLQEMGSGLVRIALECEKHDGSKQRIVEEPLWTMYCNGKKTGYGLKRDPTDDDLNVMQLLNAVSMGAGVLPCESDRNDGELMYMRAYFERVVGSRDSETFYMMNPDGLCSFLPPFKQRLGQIASARKLFDQMPHRDLIAWNAMLTSYSQSGLAEDALALFGRMRMVGIRPDNFSLTAALSASAEARDIYHGRKIHGLVIRFGYHFALPVCNSLIDMYGKCLSSNEASIVFQEMSYRNEVSWCSLLYAYVKVGDFDCGIRVFDTMPLRNEIAWNILIAGYAQFGEIELCLDLFKRMVKERSVLHACSNLAVIKHGIMVHGCAVHRGFTLYVYVGNGLVNMYAKCGDIEGSTRAFSDILEKDLVSWNAMVFGFGLHGRANEAIRLYDYMLKSKIQPDKVTFVGLLMACSHSGLIEKGQVIFKSMVSVYGFVPGEDHVACMVDIFGRSGLLSQASKMIDKYKISRETLLGACAAQGDLGNGLKLGEDLVKMDPQKEIGYVMLSNMYCASGQWKKAEKVRKEMVEHGVKKMPGCSWIEVKNSLTVFVAEEIKELSESIVIAARILERVSFMGLMKVGGTIEAPGGQDTDF
ncbi:hypothetical protein GIB67_034477 [Kingdonia uniflora]|uniref:Pentatricopeptide repeat-containing protein n=1 Tax=Kingdonia uniflora TaxID=39325 RepID=A0A7J7PAY3_9MAGN|nr:hypothetical protein GIB67_034477 [Kingdonia uniflora]